MDTILYNGKIKTLDKACPEAEAVAIKNGIIAMVGSNEDILRWRTPARKKST